VAVRFDVDSDKYTTTTALPGSTFTITCWAYLAADRNAFSCILHATGTSSFWIETDSDGTTLDIFGGSGSSIVVGPSLTVGTWYKLAAVVSGTSATFYWADISTGTLSSASSSSWPAPSSVTSMAIGGVTNNATESWNGRVAAVKLWTAALTTTQIDAELNQFTPVVTSGLQRYHPFHVAETTDYSGNGNTLSGGTGATTEADPAISGHHQRWNRCPRRHIDPCPGRDDDQRQHRGGHPDPADRHRIGDRVFVVRPGTTPPAAPPPAGQRPRRHPGRADRHRPRRGHRPPLSVGVLPRLRRRLDDAGVHAHLGDAEHQRLLGDHLRKGATDTWDTPPCPPPGTPRPRSPPTR
jgi:hypothetical protein